MFTYHAMKLCVVRTCHPFYQGQDASVAYADSSQSHTEIITCVLQFNKYFIYLMVVLFAV